MTDDARRLRAALHGVRGLLLDLDGVLVLAERPIPGAGEALATLDARGIPYLVVTNTSLVSRATLSAMGERMGLHTPPERFHSALSATAAYTARRFPGEPLFVIASRDARAEFAGQRLLTSDEAGAPDARVAAVVLGDSPEDLTRENLDRAFRLVLRGAVLVGMHRSLWWHTPAGPTLDAGAFIVGLEAAAGVRATIVGKPTAAFFRPAIARLRAEIAARDGGRVVAGDLVMVGDDLSTDVAGGRRLGLRTVFVRSGKHGEAELAAARAGRRGLAVPDAVAPSVAEVVAALG